jgi:putative membrane protein|tara:strand:- start:26512 stop:27408 length:897 start_codon:yes stop_codon:yes gene_type:complete
MINYNPKSWFKLIFAIHKSDTLRILWKELIYIGVFTLLIDFVVMHFFPEEAVLDKLISVYSLIGFVISLLLVFRTNTAYDRWWEGRRKWGEMVNDTRNLASKLSVLLTSEEDKDFFKRMIPNFVFASKEHLRKGVDLQTLKLTVSELDSIRSKNHIPLAISNLMFNRIIQLREKGVLNGDDIFILDKNLNALMDSIGACERIKNTPIPYSYSLFIKKFIFIYVTTLPLAFVTTFGYWSALIATFVFYVLVSMEVLAEEIEDPFGTDDNDLPTDQLCERIEANVVEVLGRYSQKTDNLN